MYSGVTRQAAPTEALPLLRLGEWRESLDHAPPPAANLPALSLAPEILVRSDARRMRARGTSPVPPPAERARILRHALDVFACHTLSTPTLGRQSAPRFRAALRAWAGLPAPLVDRWCELLRASLGRILEAAAPAEGGRRPPLTLVSLPGNTFTCLESVLAALASGSAVWVRPSAREPLSALRLVSALIQAGWPADLLGFYPTTREVLPALVKVTDRQVVYGGAEVCASLRPVPTATLHGPLRVCAVVPETAEPAATTARLLPLVAGDGGRFCTTVRAIFCLGDPALLAARLARALDAIGFSPPDAALPLASCATAGAATASEAAVRTRLRPGDRRLTRRPIHSRDGHRSYLAPTLIRLADRPADRLAWGDPALLGFEAPFPLATITRVTAAQAAALTAGADLVHRLPAGGLAGGPS